MLFFAADDHGVTVAPAVAAQRAGGAEIPHRVDGKGAAIRPGDGAGLHKQKRYEDEVIRCLDGQSRFSEEMLARLIAEAETEVRQAKEEYAELLRNDTTRATIQQIRSYYDEFLGWANEFDLATIPRKRAILGQLIEKVEVGKGYKVTVHLRMSYAQFLGIEGNGEIQVRKDVCA